MRRDYHAIPHPQTPLTPYGPNETVFLHIIPICEYVFMRFAFLPSIPAGRRNAHPRIKSAPDCDGGDVDGRRDESLDAISFFKKYSNPSGLIDKQGGGGDLYLCVLRERSPCVWLQCQY